MCVCVYHTYVPVHFCARALCAYCSLRDKASSHIADTKFILKQEYTFSNVSLHEYIYIHHTCIYIYIDDVNVYTWVKAKTQIHIDIKIILRSQTP